MTFCQAYVAHQFLLLSPLLSFSLPPAHHFSHLNDAFGYERVSNEGEDLTRGKLKYSRTYRIHDLHCGTYVKYIPIQQYLRSPSVVTVVLHVEYMCTRKLHLVQMIDLNRRGNNSPGLSAQTKYCPLQCISEGRVYVYILISIQRYMEGTGRRERSRSEEGGNGAPPHYIHLSTSHNHQYVPQQHTNNSQLHNPPISRPLYLKNVRLNIPVLPCTHNTRGKNRTYTR